MCLRHMGYRQRHCKRFHNIHPLHLNTSSMHHRLGENIVYRSWRMGLDVAAYEEHETQRICVYLQAKSASHIATETQTRLFSSHICSHCSVWLIIILFYAQCSIRSALPVTHSSSVPVVTPSLPKTTVISYPEYYMPWKHKIDSVAINYNPDGSMCITWW